jgi:hypothetical protein
MLRHNRRFEPSQEARARATAEGNSRPEDLIPIYRKRTMIDTSGKETTIKSTYLVVDGVEALSKFGPDCWDRVVCVMTTGQAWQFRPYKWSEPRQLFHNGKKLVSSRGMIFKDNSHSERHLCLLVKRSSKYENQGLECYRTQGKHIMIVYS